MLQLHDLQLSFVLYVRQSYFIQQLQTRYEW